MKVTFNYKNTEFRFEDYYFAKDYADGFNTFYNGIDEGMYVYIPNSEQYAVFPGEHVDNYLDKNGKLDYGKCEELIDKNFKDE